MLAAVILWTLLLVKFQVIKYIWIISICLVKSNVYFVMSVWYTESFTRCWTLTIFTSNSNVSENKLIHVTLYGVFMFRVLLQGTWVTLLLLHVNYVCDILFLWTLKKVGPMKEKCENFVSEMVKSSSGFTGKRNFNITKSKLRLVV